MTGLIGKTGNEALRYKWADLLGRKIDDTDHLLADQLFEGVVFGDLYARSEVPDFPKVDEELVGSLAGLRKWFGGDDGPDPQVKLLEFAEVDGVHGVKNDRRR